MDEQKIERRKRQKQHDKTRWALEQARDAVQEHKLKDLTEDLKNCIKAIRIHEDTLIEQEDQLLEQEQRLAESEEENFLVLQYIAVLKKELEKQEDILIRDQNYLQRQLEGVIQDTTLEDRKAKLESYKVYIS